MFLTYTIIIESSYNTFTYFKIKYLSFKIHIIDTKYIYANLIFYKKMASTTSASIENDSTKNGSNVDMEKQLKERAERNRQKALLLKKSKIVTHPYTRYMSSIYIYIYI